MIKEIEEYFEYLEKVKYSLKTIKNRKTGLKRFNEFVLNNNLELHSIRAKQINEYITFLLSLNLSETSINDYIARVREFFNSFLVKVKNYKLNPFTEMKSNRNKKYYPEQVIKQLDEMQNYLKAKNYKKRSIEDMLRVIRDYLLYSIDNNIDIYKVNIKEAEAYREYLRLLSKPDGSARYNPKTINGVISHLNTYYLYLVSINKAFINPFKNIERMRESFNLPKNILTIQQTKKLLENIEVKNKYDFKFKVLIEILYSTGARINEITKLTLKDVDLVNGFLMIYNDKEGQDRRIVLTEYAEELLRLYIKYVYDKKNKTIFSHGTKQRTLNSWVNYRLKGLCLKLKLPCISCHSLRHMIATHMFKKGADIREVQEYLGHRIIKNTEVYTRIFPDDLKKVIDKTHPREIDYAVK